MPEYDSVGIVMYTCVICKEKCEIEIPRLADIDGDGDVNMKDLLILRKAVAGVIELTYEQGLAADINCDGDLNLKDILMLRKIIAGVE